MEDHRHEEYVPPPKPKVQAFSGAGHKLGRYATSFSFFCLENTHKRKKGYFKIALSNFRSQMNTVLFTIRT